MVAPPFCRYTARRRSCFRPETGEFMVVRRVYRRYPSGLTDAEWNLIEPLVRSRPGPGRPRVLDLRAIMNALRYLNRTGCLWEYLPTDFPNQNSVRYYFDKYTYDGTWGRINDALRA